MIDSSTTEIIGWKIVITADPMGLNHIRKKIETESRFKEVHQYRPDKDSIHLIERGETLYQSLDELIKNVIIKAEFERFMIGSSKLDIILMVAVDFGDAATQSLHLGRSALQMLVSSGVELEVTITA